MTSKAIRSWGDFLNPDVTRPRLIAASVFIAGFEALKESIVGRIRSFFWTGFDESGDKLDPKYESDVLSRNKSPVYASLEWLKERGAVDDQDLAAFGRVKTCRNTLAHELLSALGSEGLPPDFEERLKEMLEMLKKIEVWWIANVEIPTDPDLDGAENNEDGITTGPVVVLQLLVEIALGEPERSYVYYQEFCRRTNSGN